MNRILIVEDEASVRAPLKDYLEKEGFGILEAATLKEADLQLQYQPDIILLDWMLPDGQSIESLKRWRAKGLTTPIVMLTARADLIDKVLGLELGANDFVTKPFEPRELVARIRAHLRARITNRDSAPAANELSAGDIVMNLDSYEVSFLGVPVTTTKTEFELLKTFVEHPNQVFSREDLLKKVWGYDQYPSTRTVDTHVLQLRQKLKTELFETVHGIGYRFRSGK